MTAREGGGGHENLPPHVHLLLFFLSFLFLLLIFPFFSSFSFFSPFFLFLSFFLSFLFLFPYGGGVRMAFIEM